MPCDVVTRAKFVPNTIGLRCIGAQAAWRGRKRWEEKYPAAAATLRELPEAHAQQDPTVRTPRASPRLTAKAAGEALRAREESGLHCWLRLGKR